MDDILHRWIINPICQQAGIMKSAKSGITGLIVIVVLIAVFSTRAYYLEEITIRDQRIKSIKEDRDRYKSQLEESKKDADKSNARIQSLENNIADNENKISKEKKEKLTTIENSRNKTASDDKPSLIRIHKDASNTSINDFKASGYKDRTIIETEGENTEINKVDIKADQ